MLKLSMCCFQFLNPVVSICCYLQTSIFQYFALFQLLEFSICLICLICLILTFQIMVFRYGAFFTTLSPYLFNVFHYILIKAISMLLLPSNFSANVSICFLLPAVRRLCSPGWRPHHQSASKVSVEQCASKVSVEQCSSKVSVEQCASKVSMEQCASKVSVEQCASKVHGTGSTEANDIYFVIVLIIELRS